jgi:two-component system, OmpR family, phosphate regulon sensor histidine kinase PhoR
MSALIEPVTTPLILADNQRIIAANLSACVALGRHIIGQDARIALRHPDAVQLLDQIGDGSATINGLTGARSQWHLTLTRINSQFSLIEMLDRNLESDISRAHTDFVANASHELRTPLASVIGYVETLADGSGQVDAETSQRFMATVLREARRMENLVSDLMSLSQLEAEKSDAPTTPLDLGAAAQLVVSEMATIHGSDRVRLSVPTQSPMIMGDASQMAQLLRNLIENALKYADSSQAVEVTITHQHPRTAHLTVTDHGAGIAPEHIPHLTRRFYRTDPGRSRAAGGTGLGLAIVKHIVERHRGKLAITSQLGVGTQVSIQLPSLPPTP